MKILVADDSKTNLALTSLAISKLGHEVIPAANGRQAIELYQQVHPDLIILDVMMDEMDGFECAKKIRAIDSDDWIPIIFLSGAADDESVAKGIDAGGDDYLIKPFSEITLAAKIKAMQRIADMRYQLFETTQKLYLLSSTDPLTGIYNRFQFERSVKEILSTANHFHHLTGLLFIDVDNFKNINDTYGHHIGDLFLVDVARRLKSCIRVNDFLARLGGDEFAIVLSEIESSTTAENIARKIVKELSKDYFLEEHQIKNGASIGVAIYPTMADTQGDLISNADLAMYHAKNLGRNNFQFYTEELKDKYNQKINLEHALQFALERNELNLTYQPIFNLQHHNVIGLELLVSWEHPKFGIISPSVFIPIAEEIGLMNDISNWIFRTASKQITVWKLHLIKHFKFAINISARQLMHADFFKNIISFMNDSQLSPNQLEIELTESTIMAYGDGTYHQAIKLLNNSGINISIDDFGTGYSSLIRLKHLPISTLKIEKTFVQDAVFSKNSAIIVNCLIALGKNLGLNVIAEGIETREQYEFLLSKGCPEGQGYYLCKPLSAKRMSAFLAEQNELETT